MTAHILRIHGVHCPDSVNGSTVKPAITTLPKTTLVSAKRGSSASITPRSLERVIRKASEKEVHSIPASKGLPQTPAVQTEQAANAVLRALSDNIHCQRLEFILPVNEKESNFTNTEPMDYPCSLQKEFNTCCTLTVALIQRVIGGSSKIIISRRLDEGGVEGEPCAVLYPETSKEIVAVVYPTAERLKQIQDLAKVADRPLLIVNPQWSEAANYNIISDFGIGPWRKAAMDFIDTFQPTYILKEKRIGNPGTINAATGTRFSSGGVVRVLKEYPGSFEVHAMAANGSSQLLTVTGTEPTYKDLEELIRDGRRKKLEIFAVAEAVTYVYASSDQQERDNDGDEQQEENESTPSIGDGESLTAADIEALDAASLRRMLGRRGLATSGKITKLRERLKEALLV